MSLLVSIGYDGIILYCTSSNCELLKLWIVIAHENIILAVIVEIISCKVTVMIA